MDSLRAMEFFNSLSGRLEIELTEAPEKIAPNLMNQKAPSTAKIKSITLKAEVFENDEFRSLTAEELDRVALRNAVIRMRGEAGDPIEHRAPNGEHFSVRDLLKAVEETERQSRAKSDWFDGIDVHHVYFEGIHPEEDGTWSIHWGS